jgi:ADP-heptose:LPS heptosyltransferase
VLYKLLDWFIWVVINRLSRPRQSDTLLIIRPDNIGDYVLFRNFLPFIRQSPEYHDSKIILLGNESCRALAEYLDSIYIDKFIWVDNQKYGSYDFLYTFLINRQLYKIHYHCIFYPVFSRTNFYDKLVNNLQAAHKITCRGDNVNKSNQLDITDQVYTQIIPTESQLGVFEFERNKEIISKFLCREIELDYPVIEKIPESFVQMLPPEYVTVCLEASHKSKQWSSKNFRQIISYIINKKKLPVVLLGLDNSVKFPEEGIIDLRKKISLPEAAAVLSKSGCFIGNDSGLLHIAAAVGIKKLIAICYGAYYGRFVPYPEIEGRNYQFTFPPEIAQSRLALDELKQKYACYNYEDIKTIPVSSVLRLVDKVLL